MQEDCVSEPNRNNRIDKFFDRKIDSFNNENEITKIELVKGCSLIVDKGSDLDKEIIQARAEFTITSKLNKEK